MFGLFLVISIGIVDSGTGLELHLMGFYLFPIALMSWFVNQRAGISIGTVRVGLAHGEPLRRASIFFGSNYSLEFCDAYSRFDGGSLCAVSSESYVRSGFRVGEPGFFLLDCPMAALFTISPGVKWSAHSV